MELSKLFTLFFTYLNNRVFLSRNFRLIVAPRKIDVLKTNICPRSEASRANMLVLRTSNFQGATIRPIVRRQTLYCLYCSTLNFLPRASSKIIPNYLQLFKIKVVTAKCKILKRKLLKTHLIQFQSFSFDMPACLQQNVHGRVLSIRVFSADEHYCVTWSI